LVEATLPEAIAIVQFLAPRLNAHERQILTARINDYQSDLMPFFKREVERFVEPCPFLIENFCAIYEVRPLTCRGLTSSDATLCEQWTRGEAASPFHSAPMETIGSIASGVISGSHEAGLPSGVFELAGAVLQLLELGPAACQAQTFTAPVKKFSLVSPLNDGKFMLSEGMVGLFKTPRFVDLWEASYDGDTDTARYLAPKLKDETLSKLVNLSLPSLYQSQDELEENWARLGDAVTDFENAKLDPKDAYERLVTLTTRHWALAGKDVRSFIERVVAKVHRDIVVPTHPVLTQPLPERRRPGRFRLGYLSSHLTNFSGSRWAVGWIANRSPEIEAFVFNCDREEDEFTNVWRRLCDHYFHLPIPPARIAEVVRNMDLDALIFIDLGVGRFDHQLGCMRLARRQFAAPGCPVTSGSPAIDGYLSSALMEPEGAQAHYTERLTLLPGAGWCFPRIEHKPTDVDSTQLGLPASGYFVAAQSASRKLPLHDEVYRRISESSGKPIVFTEPHGEFNREKFADRLKAAQINAVVVRELPVCEFLGLVANADAVLDTPSWNGGASTIAALALGKPVISCATEFMRGRRSLALHAIAGVPDLIAKDLDDYVALALDQERQVKAMRRLDVLPLYEDKATVGALDHLLLEGFEG
jgi:hypothetical protein